MGAGSGHRRDQRIVDLWAGAAAATVVLTQAMAFGVALHEPYTGNGALGALAGLVAAVWLCLASGLGGGSAGLISAPTGPTLVLLGAIAAALANAGLEGAAVLQALALVIAISGVLQMVVGVTGGGRIIKLIPLPVIAGFMTGSGVLMIMSQADAVSGGAWSDFWHYQRADIAWAPIGAAVVTIACMQLRIARLSAVPAPLLGLVVGTFSFHAFCAMGTGPPPIEWMVGSLPGIGHLAAINFWSLPGDLPWAVMLVSAVALCVLASLDSLLTCVLADSRTGVHHDTRRELVSQGAGHVMCAITGAMAGAGTTAATMVAVSAGGRRRAGVGCAVAIALLVLVLRDATVWVPVSVLGAVVVHVAIGLLEPDIVAWWRFRRTRNDALVAVLVTVVTVGYDLMTAVALGVVIAAIRFIANQVRTPVVLRRVTARGYRSQRDRSPAEQAALDDHGDAVVLYELRGPLFFGTTDRLFEEVEADLDAGRRIVVSLRRVTQVDLTGMALLRQMARRARDSGGEMVFANVHKRTGLGRKVRKALRRASYHDDGLQVRTFKSSDVAFERAEDRLLDELGVRTVGAREPHSLADSELCAEMNAADVRTLSDYMRPETAATGAGVYRVGEPGGTLYVLCSGNVDIRLTTGPKHYSRLARLGPGMVFGEASFTTPGAHTASAVATEPCTLETLRRSDFDQLASAHPALALTVLDVLAGLLARRLRLANREIYQLNQF